VAVCSIAGRGVLEPEPIGLRETLLSSLLTEAGPGFESTSAGPLELGAEAAQPRAPSSRAAVTLCPAEWGACRPRVVSGAFSAAAVTKAAPGLWSLMTTDARPWHPAVQG